MSGSNFGSSATSPFGSLCGSSTASTTTSTAAPSGFNPSAAASGSAPAKAKWGAKLPLNFFLNMAAEKAAKNKKNQKKKQRQKLKKAEQASKDITTESKPPVALAPEINDTDAKAAREAAALKRSKKRGRDRSAASKDITTSSIESEPVALAPEINDTHSGDQQVNEYAAIERQMNTARSTLSDMPAAVDDDSRNDEQKIALDDVSSVLSPPSMCKHQTHLKIPNEAVGSSSTPSGEAAGPQIMPDMMDQLIDMQRELQKQMTIMEMAVEQKLNNFQEELKEEMTKAVEAEIDALCDQLGEEISKQLTGLINYFVSKDFQVIIEEMVKNELADVGQAVVRLITPAIEKCQATTDLAISNYFQKGDGYEAFNQLEKSVNSKLEATVPEQIKAQFQTSGEQALRKLVAPHHQQLKP
ncbi:hypothetical protein ACLB2K_073949 [Fragaria x ananassa]